MKEEQAGSEFPRKGASHNGTSEGYSIEVRYTGHRPQEVCGMILGKEWQPLKVLQTQQPFGVPIARPWNERIFGMLGLYDYAAAQAMRWWFHANAEATPAAGAMGVESRLVAHKVQFSVSEEAIYAHQYISAEDRSNCKPDWNKAA
jgi:hypothetical protein